MQIWIEEESLKRFIFSLCMKKRYNLTIQLFISLLFDYLCFQPKILKESEIFIERVLKDSKIIDFNKNRSEICNKSFNLIDSPSFPLLT